MRVKWTGKLKLGEIILLHAPEKEVSVSKTANKDDMLKLGKDLFFSNGSSPEGSIEQFAFEIKDFKDIATNVTIDELRNKTPYAAVLSVYHTI